MRAEYAYRLIVGRTGGAPAPLAEVQRIDHVEVVEIDGGEVVLFWDCPPVRGVAAGARPARGPRRPRGRRLPRALERV